MDIARHLEVLLLSNDCVAIPGFGGFVAYYVSAHVDESDGTFLPPMRTIGFNPQLKMNDSILAQSYVEAYDISYPEALRRIEQDIENIKRQITHEGCCLLEGIGMLSTNEDGAYYFVPGESGLLTPTLYGLSSFDFPSLKSPSAESHSSVAKPIEPVKKVVKEELPQQELLEIVDTEEYDEEHAIHIKMSWVRNTVAVAAAVALFFLLTTPVTNSDFGSQTMSALQNSFIHKLIPNDSNMKPATPVITNNIVAKDDVKKDSAPVANKDTISSQTIQPTDLESPYCLVLASQVKRSNAEEFVRILREKGFKDTDVYIHNNVVRVVFGHFKTENAAYVELHNLRFEDFFEEAWVYKRKTEG